MKAIILAAGMGTRLGQYTKNLPKGRLKFMGKSLIERQVDTLRSAGVEDIVIVKGYMPDEIQIPNVKYYLNEDYANTNMVETLFAAEEQMNDEMLVCYSDIIYESSVVEKAMSAKVDIGVVADKDYLSYWQARLDDWQNDIESFVIDDDGGIVDLGNKKCEMSEAQTRIVGIVKYSRKGAEILKKVYHENKRRYFDKDEPWLRSKSFKKAYTTCILQAIIDHGYRVDPVLISGGWMEFDTVEDYERALSWVEDGSVGKFINLS